MPRGSLPQHGHSPRVGPSPEYSSWQHMKTRCLSKNFKQHHDYGGRGITVYEPWITSFPSFLEYIGPKPEPKKLYSLDRKDNNRGYEPGNVRWATKEQQTANKRRQKPETREGYIAVPCRVCGKEFMKHPARKYYYCSKGCNSRFNGKRYIRKKENKP